jgi:hypothetical protein
MTDPLSRSFEITIRQCRHSNLYDLEWFGRLTNFREIIAQTFDGLKNGEIVMLVAEVNRFPIGPLCIDLIKQQEGSIGVLWAFGYGYHFKDWVLVIAEIEIEKDNLYARRLYERVEYQEAKDSIEAWDYTTPEGKGVHNTSMEWIMQIRL